MASALFLDNKSAFPAAVPERLYHILRMRGVPVEYVRWLRTKLTGRRTTLKFDDFASDPFLIERGIDQGCPLSVILYAFYNAALVEAADHKKGETAEGSMDDVAVIATGRTFRAVHAQLEDFMTRTGGGEDWSATHHSPFSVDKFGLVNFSRKLSVKQGRLGPALQLSTHRVAPSPYHRFLGVLVDCELRHHPQVADAFAKGTAWTTLMRRLGQSRHGLSMGVLLRLYQAVAVPRILYAADTFLLPVRKLDGQRASTGTVGHIKKLAQIQRQAVLIITGAMRTTATDVLEAHLRMLPFDLLVDKVCFRATARLCSLPPSHPLHSHVKKASRPVASHRSCMHDLLQLYAAHLSQATMEKIQPTRYPPHWEPGHLTDIAGSKEEAAESEALWAQREGIRVYSDGSELEGGVGAAAVLFNERTRGWKSLRLHLGPAEEHTVYEAETVGAVLGVELVRRERRVGRVASVALDGKSAIEGSLLRESRPSHYLTDLLHASVAAVKRQYRGLELTLRWVPGHQDIAGNEQADSEAKLAASGDSSSVRLVPAALRRPLPVSISKAKQVYNKKLGVQAAEQWRASKRGIDLRRVDPALPSARFAKLVAPLPRRNTSLLIQLRTGHAPLNHHLHRIGRATTQRCQGCGAAKETVQHFILQCPKFSLQRRAFLGPLGRNGPRLDYLMSTDEGTTRLFKYVNATQRLRQTFGNLQTERRQEANRGDDNRAAPVQRLRQTTLRFRTSS